MSLLDYCHSYPYVFIKRCLTILKLQTIIAKRIDQTNTFSIRLKCSCFIYLHDISILFCSLQIKLIWRRSANFYHLYMTKTLILSIEPFWLKINFLFLLKITLVTKFVSPKIRLFYSFYDIKKIYITLHIK